MRLITIPFSHYCEKARWALERAGVDFREDGHAPLLHWRASLGAGGGRTVPVLVTPNSVISDSTDILEWADRELSPERQLYPAALRAEVRSLEEHFDAHLGPHTRRLGYHHALPHRDLVLSAVVRSIPRWEAMTIRGLFPLARLLMRRGLRIDDAGAERSLSKLQTVWSEVEARLTGGRRFLVGERFTAADLTFAALAAPLIAPPEHPHPVAALDALPALAPLTQRLRDSAPGQHVLRMYRDHRRS